MYQAMALKEEGRSSSGNGASAVAAGGCSSTSSSSTKMSNALRQREVGCDVHAILASMFDEQRDHNFSTFGETYLKYRKVVAEWMVDVCEYFTLHATTTHAAIAYLDRLQPNEKFSRFEWQMLAICCILIAGMDPSSSVYNILHTDSALTRSPHTHPMHLTNSQV